MDNLSLAHAKWKCQYHIVFIPKYRRKVLYGKLRVDIKEIIGKLCSYKNIEIVSGAVCSDHIHLCVSIPPKIAVSGFVEYLKGNSACDARLLGVLVIALIGLSQTTLEVVVVS